MKHRSIATFLSALFLSFLIAMSGLGCLVTAFDLFVADWTVIAAWCGGFCLLAACFFCFRWGSLTLSALALATLNYLLRKNQLLLSAEALINRISRMYDSGYGWGYIRWSQESLADVSTDIALIVLGCLVICAIAWTVLQRKWLGFGLLGGLFPLLLCCVLLDTVPHWLPLLILICCLFILTLSHRARKFDMPHGNALTVRLLIPVILFCSLIFLTAPTVSYQEPAKLLLQTTLEFINDLTNPDTGNGGGSGNLPGNNSTGTVVAEDLDLQQVGPLALGKQRIMVVSSNFRGRLYLRAQAYDTYTGTFWEVNADSTHEGGWPVGIEPESPFSDTNNITIYSLTMDPFRYVPYYIRTPNWTASLQSGMLVNTEGLQRYTLPLMIASEITQVDPLSQEEKDLYLSLPDTTREAADTIVQQILASVNADTVDSQALAIAEYVKNSAVYDLNTAAMPADASDFALWFLEESETGYCVHFATAATVLLRAAGIPARYVSGYMTDQAISGNTNITADQAHAWVEYLDPNTGWTVLEATPGAEEPEPTDPTGTTDPTETAPTEETIPPTEAPTEAPTEPPQTDPTQITDPTDPPATDISQPNEPSFQWNWNWLKPLLLILLAAGILWGQRKLRLCLRKKWLSQGQPNRQAVRRWKYIRRLARLTRQKLPKHLRQLTEKAVFSQYTLTDEELSQYDSWIHSTHLVLLEKKQPLRIILQLLLAI